MKNKYSDYQLGVQHGKLGFEAQCPNNINYMLGFIAGEHLFSVWAKQNEPLVDERPIGTNDMLADYY